MKTQKHENTKTQILKKCFCVFCVLRRSRVFSCFRDNNGFIALISILIIGAAILTIGIGLSLRSIGGTNMSLNEELSNRASALSDACAEHALLALKENLSYNGGETLTLQSGLTCQIFSVSGEGNTDRIIQTQSDFSGYISKMQVVVSQVNPDTIISSWEEVGDF